MQVRYQLFLAVRCESVTTVRDLDNLSHTDILLLFLERSVCDSPWRCVVFFAGNNQERSAIWILNVNLTVGRPADLVSVYAVATRTTEKNAPPTKCAVKLKPKTKTEPISLSPEFVEDIKKGLRKAQVVRPPCRLRSAASRSQPQPRWV